MSAAVADHPANTTSEKSNAFLTGKINELFSQSPPQEATPEPGTETPPLNNQDKKQPEQATEHVTQNQSTEPTDEPTSEVDKDIAEFNKQLSGVLKKPEADKKEDLASEEVELPKAYREQAKAFKEVNQKLKAKTNQLDAVTKELEEVKKKAELNESPLKKELDVERGKYKEVEDTLTRVRLEETSQFKQAFTAPITDLTKELKVLTKQYEIKYGDLVDALEKGDPAERRVALKELTSGLDDPADALQIREKAAKLAELQEHREKVLVDAKAHYELISQKEKEQHETKRKEYLVQTDKAFKEQWSEFQERTPFLQKNESNPPEVNEAIDQIYQAAAKADADPSWLRDPKVRANALYQALAYPFVVENFTRLFENAKGIIEKQTTRIKELTAARPGVGSGTTAKNDKPEFKNIGDAVSAIFNR